MPMENKLNPSYEREVTVSWYMPWRSNHNDAQNSEI
jgi:hypothetical protein